MANFDGSKKVYVEGSRPDILVPMREISLSPTTGSFGEEVNAPVRVYDTSGHIQIQRTLSILQRDYQLFVVHGLKGVRI